MATRIAIGENYLDQSSDDSASDVDFVPNSSDDSSDKDEASENEAQFSTDLIGNVEELKLEINKWNADWHKCLMSRYVDYQSSESIGPSKVSDIRREMEASLSRISERRVIFAGKEYILQCDVNGEHQRLIGCENDGEDKSCAAIDEQMENEYIEPSKELERIRELGERIQAMTNTAATAAQKVSAVFKTKVDWRNHVEKAEDKEALTSYRRGKSAYLDKKRFLKKLNS